MNSLKKKHGHQSPLPLQQRKPLEFSLSSSKKNSPQNIDKNNKDNILHKSNEIFKDSKIKDKLVGYFHKTRENKEKLKSMVLKVNNQLKLKDESEDDSQESEKEGYNEQLSKVYIDILLYILLDVEDIKQMKARNKLNLLKKNNILRRVKNN